jgi:hypothetical protein
VATIAGISVDIGGDNSGLKKALKDSSNSLNEFARDTNKAGGGMSETFAKVGKGIAAAFAIDKIVEFGKKTIEITAQFEKLGAVLSSTLGSKAEAQVAFGKIQEFAAQTNFSVLELTENFVSLANRGIRPTTENLTSIADVANVLGKPLDDVVQAILDVTNTERWNELGIKVKKAGDTITATFRDQTVSAKATEQGALDLVTAIGKFEGVAGSTAKISETLSGKMSNLGDAFDTFFATLGGGKSGLISDTFQLITDGVNKVSNAIQTSEQKATQIVSPDVAAQLDEFKKSLTETADAAKISGANVSEAVANQGKALKQGYSDELRKAQQALKDFNAENDGLAAKLNRNLNPFNALAGGSKAYENALVTLNERVLFYSSVMEALPSLQNQAVKSTEALAGSTKGLIEGLESQIKAQKEVNEKATDTKVLAAGQASVKNLKEQLEALQKLGTQNSLEVITDKLEKYYGILGNPDATNAAVANAAKEVRALESVRDALQNNIDARVSNNLVPENLQNLQSIKNPNLMVPLIQSLDIGDGSIINPEKFFSAEAFEKIQTRLGDFKTELDTHGVDIVNAASAMQSGLASAFTGLGEIIGSALTGSLTSMEGAFNAILGLVASFMKQFGAALISAGIAALAFENLALSPPAAIIAGIALIAAAAVVSNLIKKGPTGGGGGATGFAAGGLVFGPTMGLVGEGSGTSRRNPEVIAPLDRLKNLIGGNGGEVVFRIEGEVLKGVLRNYDRGADRRG